MRILLLPINSRNTLIYAQKINKQIKSESTRVDRITARITNKWLQWEAYESGWQKKVTVYGNQLFTKIPYQEWGLKSIPPLKARRQTDELKGDDGLVEVVFPSQNLPVAKIPDVLRTLATERQMFHRQRMWWTILGSPLTIPFAIVPVVPNLPFLYMAWRAWSHWKALRGSQHITHLLNNKLLKYSESEILQRIYDIKELPKEVIKPLKDDLAQYTDTGSRVEAFAKMIEAEPAAESTGHLVSLCYDLPQIDTEMERAFAQVQRQVEDGKAAAAEKSVDPKVKGKDKDREP